MNEKTNKLIEKRLEQLRSDKYTVGYDSLSDGSQSAFALFNNHEDRFTYITNKKWKVKLGMFIARLFGIKIVRENTTKDMTSVKANGNTYFFKQWDILTKKTN